MWRYTYCEEDNEERFDECQNCDEIEFECASCECLIHHNNEIQYNANNKVICGDCHFKAKEYTFTPTHKKGVGDEVKINGEIYTIALDENGNKIFIRPERERVKIKIARNK